MSSVLHLKHFSHLNNEILHNNNIKHKFFLNYEKCLCLISIGNICLNNKNVCMIMIKMQRILTYLFYFFYIHKEMLFIIDDWIVVRLK